MLAQKLCSRSNIFIAAFGTLSRSKTKHSPRLKNTKPYKRRPFPLYETQPLTFAPKLPEKVRQKFDNFLVLDFEATCASPGNLDPQEIIEFPVLKLDGKSLQVSSCFHSYVKPVIFPELTSFCTELTGIIQSMVDESPTFPVVFQNFLTWLEKENILNSRFAFVTSGDADLDYLFPMQCLVSNIEVPDYMQKWINIKKSFCDLPPYMWPDNLPAMLQHCNLKPYGELHSGLDDAHNIARVLLDLAQRGLVYDYNGMTKK